MASVEELLEKLEERLLFGEISEERYKDLRAKLLSRSAGGIGSTQSNSVSGSAAATPTGGNIQDSVIKGDVSTTTGAASVGNINVQIGGQGGSVSPEYEYERFIVMILRAGGSIEHARRDLDDRRHDLRLTLRVAREIERGCVEEHSARAFPKSPEPATNRTKASGGESPSSPPALPDESNRGRAAAPAVPIPDDSAPTMGPNVDTSPVVAAQPSAAVADLLSSAKKAYEAEDFTTAMDLYRRAADAGDINAMYAVAVLYDNGEGVPQDYRQAMAWYRKAADAGDADAMRSIAILYYMGDGVPKDFSQAMAWYRKAADAGDAEAMYAVGVLYRKGQGAAQDDSQAMAWYRKAAEAGDANGMHELGLGLRGGRGGARDEAEGLMWLWKAAEAGNPSAMSDLGLAYEEGRGVTRDYSQALGWFRKAAGAGELRGTAGLARMLTLGRGTFEFIDVQGDGGVLDTEQ